MKKVVFIIAVLSFFSCEKDGLNLPRNNPNDINGSNYQTPAVDPPQLVFSRWKRTNSYYPIHSGDVVELDVYIRNNGKGSAGSGKVVISSNSSYISTGFFGDRFHDYILVGNEKVLDGTIKFSISSSTPIGTVIVFNLTGTVASPSYNWSDSFTITIQ